ncbi:ferrous iron transport protein A [Acinetobacter marinus]|uniref:Ferrous iron transport protein A n=1 Tax=Acinetobacter marinus TaxID=281375 RepID=A0A1G6HCD0_9GAMM|nr:FeoA family protein [Acinetobacter marinus]SDB91748.1 ferrous iron transport protein A [Acinetobacter marinus]
MRLSQLKSNQIATITQVHHHLEAPSSDSKDAIATRLLTLGFVAGEKVEVLTRGIFGGEPLLIKIGFTRFALRNNEAERIEVELV